MGELLAVGQLAVRNCWAASRQPPAVGVGGRLALFRAAGPRKARLETGESVAPPVASLWLACRLIHRATVLRVRLGRRC